MKTTGLKSIFGFSTIWLMAPICLLVGVGNQLESVISGVRSIVHTKVHTIAFNYTGDMFAGTEDGIYRSEDNGASWEFMGLTNDAVESIAVSRQNNLFALFEGGLYRSKDDGMTWKNVFQAPFGNKMIDLAEDGNVLYAGLRSQILRSSNEGDTWEYLGSFANTIQTIEIKANGDLFVGTDGWEVYRSTDNGDTWTHQNKGFPFNTSVYTIAFNSRGYVFAGTEDGIYWSEDNGEEWECLGLIDATIRSLAFNQRDELLVIYNDQLLCSGDLGKSWKPLFKGKAPLRQIQLDGKHNLYLITQNDVIYHSKDHGRTWLLLD